jgi:hypothetical protein
MRRRLPATRQPPEAFEQAFRQIAFFALDRPSEAGPAW